MWQCFDAVKIVPHVIETVNTKKSVSLLSPDCAGINWTGKKWNSLFGFFYSMSKLGTCPSRLMFMTNDSRQLLQANLPV